MTTPAPQPQQEYIITEDQLCKLIHGIDDALECHYFMKEIRSRPAPSPCEENGCTDIDNCDEICDHSRVYSPVQMREAAAQARNATLDLAIGNIEIALRQVQVRRTAGKWDLVDATDMIRAAEHYLESLRTQSQSTDDAIPFSDWLSINNAKVRNATLDKLQSKFLDAMNERSFTDSDGDYFQCSQLSKDEIDMIIESLRGKP
jgi:hypothetical protein